MVVSYFVGAGSARPNTSTGVSVGAFGRAKPAPTISNLIFKICVICGAP